MQTHQYLSSNDSRPNSFHQETNGVVYRVAHLNVQANGGVPRQTTYHNRLSYRAFGAPPSTSANVTSNSQSTGLVQPLTSGPAMTSSWPNNGNLTNNGWINLALDSADPYQLANNGDISTTMTLDKSYSHNKPIQNGTLNKRHSIAPAGLQQICSPSKQANGQKQHCLEPRLTVSSQQIYASLLSLFVIGFPACIFSILAFQLLTTLSYTFSTTDNPLAVQPSKANEYLRDLAVGLCSVSLATSITSILSSFLQCYLCLKILKTLPESRIRIVLYLRSNVYLRLFIDGGFFIGIICFLLSVIIYVHLFSNSTSASPTVSSTVVTVIVGVAVLLCLAVMIHGAYSWLCGRLNLNDDEKFDSKKISKKKNQKSDIDKNLSTLV